jgi:hypothetical protein
MKDDATMEKSTVDEDAAKKDNDKDKKIDTKSDEEMKAPVKE